MHSRSASIIYSISISCVIDVGSVFNTTHRIQRERPASPPRASGAAKAPQTMSLKELYETHRANQEIVKRDVGAFVDIHSPRSRDRFLSSSLVGDVPLAR